jgi:hypothetical protein
MTNRVQNKKKSKRLKTKRTVKKRVMKKNEDIEKVLIENFITLQRVMTNLSSKFDNLSNRISELLDLFEISAKALAEKESKIEKGENDKQVAERLEKLIDQNKTIARGLTMLHEKNIPQLPPEPLPPIPPQRKIFRPLREAPKKRVEEEDNYQKSISSLDED